jgi:predicted DNA-binding transcriptional regulator AlpA
MNAGTENERPKSSRNTEGAPDRLLSSKEVAHILRCSEASLSRWRHERTGPDWINLNGMPRYLKADVEAFIVSRRT